jgi:hypothetical protein
MLIPLDRISLTGDIPIALLEAMSYGLSVLVSDIPDNLEVGLSNDPAL